MAISSRSLFAALAMLVTVAPGLSQAQPNRRGPAPEASAVETPAGARQPGPAGAELSLPANKSTTHTIRGENGPIEFTATAGAIPLYDARSGQVTARIGFIAFVRNGADARRRPVAFAWNGGPGYASAWLNLGALGPWRLDLEAAAARPSLPPAVADNPQSWLEFTDLVFLDPPGTGFGQIPGGDDARKSFWSIEGDVAALSVAVRRWASDNGRILSPKFLAGESYGGFRAPRIAHRLMVDEGVGVSGLILVSPVLDFARFRSGGVLSHVARLPSYAATARERSGRATRAMMREAEDYARGPYLADLMAGMKNRDALARLTDNVTRLTGLERALVERHAGRVPMNVFVREFHAAQGRVASMYDGSATGLDPNPFTRANQADDQLLRGLHAPLVGAMVDIHQNRLQWLPANARYQFQNEQASSQWDWGRRDAESVSDLQKSLALDPGLRVLVAHGLTDLVTPYFETAMVLDQMPALPGPQRLRFEVYSGGHMFYSREDSRKSFRDDVRALIEAASRGSE